MAKVRLYTGIKVPDGHPGKLACETSYRLVIRDGLRKKYGEEAPKDKELWHHKHTAVRRKKAALLWLRQNGQCIFCNNSTSLEKREKGKGGNMATLDHVLPQSLGGTDHMSNLVIACKNCNMARGSMDFHVFAELRWSKSEKTFRDALNGLKKKARDKNRHVKQLEMRASIVWGVGVLLYVQPAWLADTEALAERHRARMAYGKAKRLAKKLEREGPPLADLVPHALPSALPFPPSGSHGPVGLEPPTIC